MYGRRHAVGLQELPGATIGSCKAEKEEGHDQEEVNLDLDGQKIEIDVARDGRILQTESPRAFTV